MARPRAFNEDEALDGAMHIFWRQGYGATNLPDLLKAMGLTRGSFYKAYKDKRSVYIAALKRYNELNIGQAVALLNNQEIGDAQDRLVELFQRAFDGLPTGKDRTGCFVCNAMVELAPSDPEVAELTSGIFERIQETMCEALMSLPALKSKSSLEIRHKAALLANLYFGAQAVSKTGLAMPPWNDLIQAILMQQEQS